MSGSPELRNKLEAAIKANQAATKSKYETAASEQTVQQQKNYNPTIKLTMDFSNFSKKSG